MANLLKYGPKKVFKIVLLEKETRFKKMRSKIVDVVERYFRERLRMENQVEKEGLMEKILPMLEVVGMVVMIGGVAVGGSVLAAYSFWGVSLF